MGETIDLAKVLGLERDKVVLPGSDVPVEIKAPGELTFLEREAVVRIVNQRDNVFTTLDKERASMSVEAHGAAVAKAEKLTIEIVGMIATGPVERLNDRGRELVVMRFLGSMKRMDDGIRAPLTGPAAPPSGAAS